MKFIEKLKEKRKLKKELQECIDEAVRWDKVKYELGIQLAVATDEETAILINSQCKLASRKIQENFDRIIDIQKELKSL